MCPYGIRTNPVRTRHVPILGFEFLANHVQFTGFGLVGGLGRIRLLRLLHWATKSILELNSDLNSEIWSLQISVVCIVARQPYTGFMQRRLDGGHFQGYFKTCFSSEGNEETVVLIIRNNILFWVFTWLRTKSPWILFQNFHSDSDQFHAVALDELIHQNKVNFGRFLAATRGKEVAFYSLGICNSRDCRLQ